MNARNHTNLMGYLNVVISIMRLQIKQKALRICLLAILLSTVYNAANGQEDTKYRFGLAFSPMASWIKSDNSDINGGGLRFGFNYGLHADFNFATNYAFSTGFYISHNNAKFEDRITMTDTSGNVIYSSKEKFSLNYIDLPLLMKFRTNEIGYMTYWGSIGVTPSFRIRGRDSFDEDLNGVEIDNQNIIKSDNPAMIKSQVMNLSLTVGGGVEFALSGRTAILAGIIFNNGFVNILDDGDDEKTVLRNIGIRAGLLF